MSYHGLAKDYCLVLIDHRSLWLIMDIHESVNRQELLIDYGS